jgi:hypothetical protein
MTWRETKDNSFFISNLEQETDSTFLLGITREDNTESLYIVEACVNSSGELVRLKSVKKS